MCRDSENTIGQRLKRLKIKVALGALLLCQSLTSCASSGGASAAILSKTSEQDSPEAIRLRASTR
jgi:hypothetical protein